MTTYIVRAQCQDKGWELHIDGVGVTQSHTLAGAERMARSYISILKEVDPHSFDLDIRVEPSVEPSTEKHPPQP